MKGKYYHPERLHHKGIYHDEYHRRITEIFLKKVEEIVPEILDDLNSIIPLYNSATEVVWETDFVEINNLDDYDFEWPSWLFLFNRQEPVFVDLRKALAEWGRKYNLVDSSFENNVFLEIALEALNFYTSKTQEHVEWLNKFLPDKPQELSLSTVLHPLIDLDEDDFELSKLTGEYPIRPFTILFPFSFNPSDICYSFSKKGVLQSPHLFESAFKSAIIMSKTEFSWDPRFETWSYFEKEIDEFFSIYKEGYKTRTEKFLKELGYKKSGDIRKPQHILWFIRYQVQKCTIKEVADYYTSEHKVLSEDTVSKALHKISALLQIPLRSRM